MPQVCRIGDGDSDGDTMIVGSPTVFAGNSAFAPEFETVPVTLSSAYDVEFVRANLSVVGKYAEFDDPESISLTPATYPEDTPPVSFDGQAKEEQIEPAGEKDTPELDDCRLIELPINYNTRISQNYTIASLSTSALFPHRIRAQVGLKEQDIVCNLEALAKNILEPLREEWGPFRINSGLRVGSGRSQHNRGMAVDIQEPGWGNKKMFEVAKWAARNLPVDNLIVEHGRSVWVHLSFDRTKRKQRGQQLTMIRGRFEPGLKLYYS